MIFNGKGVLITDEFRIASTAAGAIRVQRNVNCQVCAAINWHTGSEFKQTLILAFM